MEKSFFDNKPYLVIIKGNYHIIIFNIIIKFFSKYKKYNQYILN